MYLLDISELKGNAMGVNRTSTEQFQLRLPPGLRETLKGLAERNGRSLNTEIVTRLQESLKSPYPELSGYGFEALVRRLGASVAAMENLFIATRDLTNPDARPTAEELIAIRDAPEKQKRAIIAALVDRDIDKAVALAKSQPKATKETD